MSDKSETFSEAYNPSVSFADSSLYTREPGLSKNRFSFFCEVPNPKKNRFYIFSPCKKTIGLAHSSLPCVKGGGTAQP